MRGLYTKLKFHSKNGSQNEKIHSDYHVHSCIVIYILCVNCMSCS